MFTKAIQLAPDNYRGYRNLGAIYYCQNRYEDAIAQLEHSIELRPDVIAYTNLGSAYFGLRNYAKAAESYQQGVKLDDHYGINWGNLGDALYWIPSRRAEAFAAYRKAIAMAKERLQINPRDADTWAIMGAYYAMLGDNIKLRKRAYSRHCRSHLTSRTSRSWCNYLYARRR